MSPHEVQRVHAQDGTELAWHHWPAAGPPQASVLLVHGLGEHLQRYHKVAQQFAAAGLEVGGVDLRGHGLSDGQRGFVSSWQDYVDDVRAAEALLPDPLLLVGHSMGGLVALDYLRTAPRVRSVALSGPLLGVAVEAPRWKTGLAGALSRLLPRLSLANEIDPGEVCGNIDVVKRYEEDPLTFHTVTPRWYVEMRRALERVHAAVTDYAVPLQIHAGELDRIVSLQAIQRFHDAWTAPKSLRIWPGSKHEIFNEANGEEVVTAFIEQFQPALAAAS